MSQLNDIEEQEKTFLKIVSGFAEVVCFLTTLFLVISIISAIYNFLIGSRSEVSILDTLLSYLSGVGVLIVALNTFKLFRELATNINKTFTSANIKFLEWINLGIILSFIVSIVQAFADIYQNKSKSTLEMTPLIVFAFIYGIIVVFKRGKRLADEQSLTV